MSHRTHDRTKAICFWSTTAVLAFVCLSGGVADLLRLPGTLEGMTDIGYPAYVLTILGFWKVLGAIAVLVPRFPRLKEWAYAGAFFELTGAVASHVASGSSVRHLIWPGLFALCAIVSWALRPQSRRVGTVLPARTWEPTPDATVLAAR